MYPFLNFAVTALDEEIVMNESAQGVILVFAIAIFAVGAIIIMAAIGLPTGTPGSVFPPTINGQ